MESTYDQQPTTTGQDPDGIGVRVALPLRRWTTFDGYELSDGVYRPSPTSHLGLA